MTYLLGLVLAASSYKTGNEVVFKYTDEELAKRLYKKKEKKINTDNDTLEFEHFQSLLDRLSNKSSSRHSNCHYTFDQALELFLNYPSNQLKKFLCVRPGLFNTPFQFNSLNLWFLGFPVELANDQSDERRPLDLLLKIEEINLHIECVKHPDAANSGTSATSERDTCRVDEPPSKKGANWSVHSFNLVFVVVDNIMNSGFPHQRYMMRNGMLTEQEVRQQYCMLSKRVATMWLDKEFEGNWFSRQKEQLSLLFQSYLGSLSSSKMCDVSDIAKVSYDEFIVENMGVLTNRSALALQMKEVYDQIMHFRHFNIKLNMQGFQQPQTSDGMVFSKLFSSFYKTVRKDHIKPYYTLLLFVRRRELLKSNVKMPAHIVQLLDMFSLERSFEEVFALSKVNHDSFCGLVCNLINDGYAKFVLPIKKSNVYIISKELEANFRRVSKIDFVYLPKLVDDFVRHCDEDLSTMNKLFNSLVEFTSLEELCLIFCRLPYEKVVKMVLWGLMNNFILHCEVYPVIVSGSGNGKSSKPKNFYKVRKISTNEEEDNESYKTVKAFIQPGLTTFNDVCSYFGIREEVLRRILYKKRGKCLFFYKAVIL